MESKIWRERHPQAWSNFVLPMLILIHIFTISLMLFVFTYRIVVGPLLGSKGGNVVTIKDFWAGENEIHMKFSHSEDSEDSVDDVDAFIYDMEELFEEWQAMRDKEDADGEESGDDEG
jgi:hypothetical protein